MADDTNTTKHTASFLDLPAEIRNEIYELSGSVQPGQCSECKHFILGENIDMHPHHTWLDDVPEPITFEICKIVLPRHCSRNMESLVTKVKIEPSGSPTYRSITSEHILRQPALTRVSKQIREDTLPIFYGSFTFFLPILDPVITIKLLDWLEAKTHPKLFRDVRVAWSGPTFEGSWEKARVRSVGIREDAMLPASEVDCEEFHRFCYDCGWENCYGGCSFDNKAL